MSKISAKNNELLKEVKGKTSPKVYAILLDLINKEREDLAEKVLKIDYLLDYANTCIRQKDYDEAHECAVKIKSRINKLKEETENVEHLDYLYEGLLKKIK